MSTLSEKEEAMPFSSDFIFAKGTTQSEWDFLAIPGNVPTTTPTWGYTTKTEGIDPRFKIGGALHGWFYGVVGTGGHAVDEGRKVGPDVNGYSDFAGVFGTGVFVTGVAGPSVYGQMGEDPEASFPRTMSAGVVGASNDLPGVIGWSTRRHGVVGFGYDGRGVTGRSFNSVGVHGMCDSGLDSGVVGISGMNPPGPGPKPLAGLAAAGVYGISTNNAGVVGQSANPNSFGGYFFGNVVVTGNLAVNGTISSPNKQAVVAFPDGTQRVLYCMESPEYWFEDFGAAKLKRGRAA